MVRFYTLAVVHPLLLSSITLRSINRFKFVLGTRRHKLQNVGRAPKFFRLNFMREDILMLKNYVYRTVPALVLWTDLYHVTDGTVYTLHSFTEILWQFVAAYSIRSKQNNVNPLSVTLKPQSNRPLYSNTVIGTQRGRAWAGCGPAQSPPRSTKCNSPPINGQCANFVSFDVAL